MDNNVTMNHRNSHVFITLLLVFMTSLFFVDWHGVLCIQVVERFFDKLGQGWLILIFVRAHC